MENTYKLCDYATNLHFLAESVRNHDKTCETCINGDECVVISLIWDEIHEIGRNLHIYLQNGM